MKFSQVLLLNQLTLQLQNASPVRWDVFKMNSRNTFVADKLKPKALLNTPAFLLEVHSATVEVLKRFSSAELIHLDTILNHTILLYKVSNN